jgi:hypothetical protein
MLAVLRSRRSSTSALKYSNNVPLKIHSLDPSGPGQNSDSKGPGRRQVACAKREHWQAQMKRVQSLEMELDSIQYSSVSELQHCMDHPRIDGSLCLGLQWGQCSQCLYQTQRLLSCTAAQPALLLQLHICLTVIVFPEQVEGECLVETQERIRSAKVEVRNESEQHKIATARLEARAAHVEVVKAGYSQMLQVLEEKVRHSCCALLQQNHNYAPYV